MGLKSISSTLFSSSGYCRFVQGKRKNDFVEWVGVRVRVKVVGARFGVRVRVSTHSTYHHAKSFHFYIPAASWLHSRVWCLVKRSYT